MGGVLATERAEAEAVARHSDASTRCGTCAHLLAVPYRGKTYRKCALARKTHGPGTDVRGRLS